MLQMSTASEPSALRFCRASKVLRCIKKKKKKRFSLDIQKHIYILVFLVFQEEAPFQESLCWLKEAPALPLDVPLLQLSLQPPLSLPPQA